MRTGALITDSGAEARNSLLSGLRGLDGLLDAALRIAPEVYGWEPDTTRFRGLYVTPSDAKRMLSRDAGASPFGEAGVEPFFTLDEIPQVARLAERHGLSWFDCAVVLIALAPEIDLRYERLYGYLQDDVSRRRPTVDLILNLLCPTVRERMDFRNHFAADGVLVRKSLIHLISEPTHTHPPLLSQGVKLDEQVIRELLGSRDMDSRLAPFCEYSATYVDLAALPIGRSAIEGLQNLTEAARRTAGPLRIRFAGPQLPVKCRTAEATASLMDRPLLTFDLSGACAQGADVSILLGVAVNEAVQNNAILYIDCDGMDNRTARVLVDVLRSAPAGAILMCSGTAPLDELGLATVEFPRPTFAGRRDQWRRSLEARGTEIASSDLDSLARRFRLFPDEIESAAHSAQSRACWRGSRHILPEDLSYAAREMSGRQIGNLARKVEPKYQWSDIVLPPETQGQLKAICSRVLHQHRVMDEWGFERKLSLGRGVTVLFAGPSGVGKTMAAEILAAALEIDLYKIDLSGVVSKYIGETEKNLDRIFSAAENANAILFFDEADALFGKRSEVKDSHDRYANIEVSYLLQKMETYDGVAVLASNLRQNLDDAFLRRLAFTVHFPFPSQADRRRIWTSIWPEAVPMDPDTDFDFLSATFKLTGGNIKNVALAAAFLAAEEDCPVSMRHLIVAVDREYQKMGKPLAPEIFGPYALEVAS